MLSKKNKHQAAETMDKFVRHGKRLGGGKGGKKH